MASAELAEIDSNMTGPDQGNPSGVPSDYSWYNEPTVQDGSTPPSNYDSMTMWGQVYLQNGYANTPNVRIEVRDVRSYVWSLSQSQWIQIQQSTAVQGGAYVEDFSNNASVPALTRTESDGGTSVLMQDGYNFHFWPLGERATISPSDVGGVFTEYEARLVEDNPSGPDNLAAAHYVANAGADYWLSTTASFPNNAGVFEGRFDILSSSWQIISGDSRTAAQLGAHPPPVIVLRGH
jgi:hypothetical protein